MIVRNGVWARIKPEFSSTQQAEIQKASCTPAGLTYMMINETNLQDWLAEKLRATVAQIEVGA